LTRTSNFKLGKKVQRKEKNIQQKKATEILGKVRKHYLPEGREEAFNVPFALF
jgi:hypothetical protein